MFLVDTPFFQRTLRPPPSFSAGFAIPIAVLFIISFPPVRSQSTHHSQYQASDATFSYLATKSLQSCAGWFGGYGWDLVLCVLEHFLEKLGISSLSHRCCDFCLLTGFTSAFKYCCRSRGEKLERTNITYGCLAKVVRDGGLIIALIARLSAIPGHCESLRPLIVHKLTSCSHHRSFQHVRDGHRRVLPCSFAFPPQTIHYRLSRSCSRTISQR